MARTIKRGYTSDMLFRASGNFGTPTWADVDLLGDATVNLIYDEEDTPERGKAAKTSEPTLLGIEVTGMIRNDDNGVAFAAFDAAFFGKTLVDVVCLDGGSTTNGSTGVRLEGKLSEWSEDQGVGKVLYKSFTIKPSPESEEDCQRVIVNNGAMEFTDIT